MAGRRTARRLGLHTTAARKLGRLAPVALAGGAAHRVPVRLSRAARHALRHARTARLVLRVRAVDDAGRAAKPARNRIKLG